METWSGEDQFLDCHATNDIQLGFSVSTFTFWVKFLLNNTDIVRPHAGAGMKCDEMMNLVMTHAFPSSNEILSEDDDDSAPFVGNLRIIEVSRVF